MPDEPLKPTLLDIAEVATMLPLNFPKNGIEILITRDAEVGTMPFRKVTLHDQSKVIQLAVHPTDWQTIESEALKNPACFTRDSALRLNTICGIKIKRKVEDEKHSDTVDAVAHALRNRYASERRGLHISEQETSGASDQGQ